MSHKQAKKMRREVKLLLAAGLNKNDPRLMFWTGASKRNVTRVVAKEQGE
jgi:hypothetical protein